MANRSLITYRDKTFNDFAIKLRDMFPFLPEAYIFNEAGVLEQLYDTLNAIANDIIDPFTHRSAYADAEKIGYIPIRARGARLKLYPFTERTDIHEFVDSEVPKFLDIAKDQGFIAFDETTGDNVPYLYDGVSEKDLPIKPEYFKLSFQGTDYNTSTTPVSIIEGWVEGELTKDYQDDTEEDTTVDPPVTRVTKKALIIAEEAIDDLFVEQVNKDAISETFVKKYYPTGFSDSVLDAGYYWITDSMIPNQQITITVTLTVKGIPTEITRVIPFYYGYSKPFIHLQQRAIVPTPSSEPINDRHYSNYEAYNSIVSLFNPNVNRLSDSVYYLQFSIPTNTGIIQDSIDIYIAETEISTRSPLIETGIFTDAQRWERVNNFLYATDTDRFYTEHIDFEGFSVITLRVPKDVYSTIKDHTVFFRYHYTLGVLGSVGRDAVQELHANTLTKIYSTFENDVSEGATEPESLSSIKRNTLEFSLSRDKIFYRSDFIFFLLRNPFVLKANVTTIENSSIFIAHLVTRDTKALSEGEHTNLYAFIKSKTIFESGVFELISDPNKVYQDVYLSMRLSFISPDLIPFSTVQNNSKDKKLFVMLLAIFSSYIIVNANDKKYIDYINHFERDIAEDSIIQEFFGSINDDTQGFIIDGNESDFLNIDTTTILDTFNTDDLADIKDFFTPATIDKINILFRFSNSTENYDTFRRAMFQIVTDWIQLLGERPYREFGQGIEINDIHTIVNRLIDFGVERVQVQTFSDSLFTDVLRDIDENTITALKQVRFT